MTTDCSLNYKFNTSKLQAQTKGEHVVYRNCFWYSEQFLYTSCSPHVLQKEELLTKIYMETIPSFWLFSVLKTCLRRGGGAQKSWKCDYVIYEWSPVWFERNLLMKNTGIFSLEKIMIIKENRLENLQWKLRQKTSLTKYWKKVSVHCKNQQSNSWNFSFIGFLKTF